MTSLPFTGFPKIPRLNRACTITEKIDGTNGQIFIHPDGVNFNVGSRNRWITPDQDNFGFARWVHENIADLLTLGPGHHFGEWWGLGIQRGYGLKEKRFSLFNPSLPHVPSCCWTVPVLAEFDHFDTGEIIHGVLHDLGRVGSQAAPGFPNPEGIMVYHHAAKQYFKCTFDDGPKTP